LRLLGGVTREGPMTVLGTTTATAPRIWGVLTSPALRWIALLALCAAYLQGGFDKAMDFAGAEAELAHFGVTPAGPFAALTIVVELGGSFLVLSGLYRWVGALGLAGFTLFASALANQFWTAAAPERIGLENAFFEHIGLAGGFLLVAWHDRTAARVAAPASG
jgi:uncharacterized membrane protein YphA (DoxX/SURF4 family)